MLGVAEAHSFEEAWTLAARSLNARVSMRGTQRAKTVGKLWQKWRFFEYYIKIYR